MGGALGLAALLLRWFEELLDGDVVGDESENLHLASVVITRQGTARLDGRPGSRTVGSTHGGSTRRGLGLPLARREPGSPNKLPGGRHFSTALPRLLETLLSSPGLNRTAPPYPGGENFLSTLS